MTSEPSEHVSVIPSRSPGEDASVTERSLVIARQQYEHN